MSDYQFPIEAGHIMMFARAIGETNPAYFEASRFGKFSHRQPLCRQGLSTIRTIAFVLDRANPGSGQVPLRPRRLPRTRLRSVAAALVAGEGGSMPSNILNTTNLWSRATRSL